MFKNKLSIIVLLFAATFFVSCELDELENLNNPTLESFSDGASQADVQSLAVGLESVMRNDLEFHYQTVSYLAREYYDLTGTDPRYTGEILKGPLDNNGFLTTRAYAASYRTVKAANVLITAVENSEAGFSDATKNAYYGYANTLKAYALLTVANRQYTNGIRVDVADPDNLGDFLSYDDALTFVKNLLNTANIQLNNASPEFDATISSGYTNFDTPTDFVKFNRAIAARVALYQGNNTEALSFLNNSFLDLNGDMYNGVTHVFGATGNDILNAQFYVLDQSGQEFMIHDSWINNAETGDSRVVSKSNQLASPATFDNLTASYQIAIYDNNTAPVFLIRNEELILIYAEANIGTDNPTAINAINVVRNAAGLIDYPVTGTTSDEDLIEEVLTQRKYSLLGEGHRWIDLRRLNRLTGLDQFNNPYIPLDRAGDNIIDAFPTPFSENVN